MSSSDITTKYLERVLLFKSRNNSNDYLDENQRENLLNDLLKELKFDPWIIQKRKSLASHYFRVFSLLKDDTVLINKAPHIARNQITRFIEKALALDPFNEEYLKAYLFNYEKTWKPSEAVAIRLLKVCHPNSTDFQDNLVDLKLGSETITYDYLSEDITGPLIDECVFLKEEKKNEITQPINKGDELRDIAIDAGIDKKTLKQIKKELPEFVKSAEQVFDNHWLDWTTSHKAVLSMEKALDLAPYNPRVLNAGIRFYGGFYWRLILGYSGIKDNIGVRKNFFKSKFGKVKPGSEEKWFAAKESFIKALELEERYNKFASKKAEDADIEDSNFPNSGAHVSLFMQIPGMRFEKNIPAHLAAYMDKEIIAIQVLKSHYEMDNKSKKIMIISWIGISIIVAILCYFYFIVVIIQAPLILGLFGTFGILELRKRIWQRKPIEIKTVFSFLDI